MFFKKKTFFSDIFYYYIILNSSKKTDISVDYVFGLYLTKFTIIDMNRFIREKGAIKLSNYTYDLYLFLVIYIALGLPFVPVVSVCNYMCICILKY